MLGKAGAAVVLDVETGKLLGHYRLEVATSRLAPPGSTIKPFTWLALREAGLPIAQANYVGSHELQVAGRGLDCTHRPIAEPVNPSLALAMSCNAYFFHFASLNPSHRYVRQFRRAGLDSPTGLADPEAVGRIRRARNPVEQGLQGIGLWGIDVTPAGLAWAYRRLALQTEPIIVEGLSDSVDVGTSAALAKSGTRVAGKTGTAADGSRPGTVAWFAGWAPRQRPEIVVVVFLEQGSGGSDAAPLAAEIVAAWAQSKARR